MRPSLLAITAILLGAFTSATVAYATGNVLLPSDSNASPNLGLVPAAPPPAADTSASDAKILPAPAATPDQTDHQLTVSPEPLPYTPLPAERPIQPPGSANAGGIPTTVIKEPDTSTMIPPGEPQIPPNLSPAEAKTITDAYNNLKTTGHLEVILSGRSAWSASDIEAVTEHLGIARNQVPAQCHMSVEGILLTSAGASMFNAGTATHTEAGYNGSLTNIRINIQALCNLVPLPPNRGVVIQIGEKYMTLLGGMECAPPAATAKRLTILYSGGSPGKCEFQ